MPTILQSYGMVSTRAGYWASLPTAIGALSALIIPRLATGERRFTIMAGVLTAAMLTTLMIYTATMPWLGLGLILQGICRSAMTAIAILILMNLNHGKSHHVGAASGLYFSAGEIGGVLADVTEGFAVPLFMMTGVSVVLMLLLARLRYLMRE